MGGEPQLAGLDLAWGSKKTSALAFGNLRGSELVVTQVFPALKEWEIQGKLEQADSLKGIAIDAPLIIKNPSGQRQCETELGQFYAGKVSCHSSNLTRYPQALSVRLSQFLANRGFAHLSNDKFQIECYPHPALIEIFGLAHLLHYKKGRTSDKIAGQTELANYINQLGGSTVLKLLLDPCVSFYTERSHIRDLAGDNLKENEDALDAIVCLYICGLFALNAGKMIFGNISDGYICVPRIKCIADRV